MDRSVGFSPLSSFFHQLEESVSLEQLQADFYPNHTTNFPLDAINTKQKQREQVLSCSVTALDR